MGSSLPSAAFYSRYINLFAPGRKPGPDAAIKDRSPPRLAKHLLGVGDRFSRQAKAELEACPRAAAAGVEVIPVWNKSFREHTIIGWTPGS
jgi:hypothetical protein